MTAKEKLLSTLGICRKAGKLVMGFDAVAEAAKADGLALILLAEDLSPKSGKEMAFMAEKKGVDICTAPFLMEDILQRFGKRSGILGVADQGLAGTIQTYLHTGSETETSRTSEEE